MFCKLTEHAIYIMCKTSEFKIGVKYKNFLQLTKVYTTAGGADLPMDYNFSTKKLIF